MSVNKVILVTGGNKGIGKAICEQLLKNYSDTFVYLGSRSASRGSEAVSSIIERVGGSAKDRIECLELDVSDEASVSQAAVKVGKTHSPGSLYGLVNNAGVGFGRSTQEVCAVNYFGPKNVTRAFIPLLNPEGGRVVNISSASGPMFVSKLKAEDQALYTDPNVTMTMIESKIQEAIASKCYDGEDNQSYGFSKACLNVQTRDFADMYPNLKINACTPGFISTDLTEGMGATNPPEAGTVAPLHLLFDESIGTGMYFGSDAKRSPLDRYRGPEDPPYEP